MSIKMYISRRTYGKTSRLIEDFLCDPDNTLLAVINGHHKQYILRDRKMGRFRDSVICYFSLDLIKGRKQKKRLLVDDYLFFGDKQKAELNRIVDEILINKDSEVIIETTADRLYDPVIVELARMKFWDNIHIDEYLNEDTINDIDRLKNNLVTRRNCEIICRKDYVDNFVSKEVTATQIRGEIWKVKNSLDESFCIGYSKS